MKLAAAKSPTRILLLEDAPADAALVERELRRADFDYVLKRVETREAFQAALAEFRPDIVLSDYRLPSFDGLSALEIVRREHPNLPVIMVTGDLPDIKAVDLLYAGARDYVLKDRLARLVPAIHRVLSGEEGEDARKATEERLRDALTQLNLFRALIDHSNDGIAVLDRATLRFLDANDRFCSNLGYSCEELRALDVRAINPQSTAEFRAAIMQDLLTSGSARFETFHRRKDGSEFPVDVSSRLVELDRSYIVSIVRDATERKRAEAQLFELNRGLRMLSNGNRTVLHAQTEEALMQDMCQVVVTHGGYPLCWLGLVQDENRRVKPVAIAGDAKDYVGSLDATWDDELHGRGPAGLAIRSGETQIVGDIQTDLRMLPWRERAGQHGFASMISLPLREHGRTIGVLLIYSAQAHAFAAESVALLEEMAADLAFGLVNLHTRHERDEAVKESSRYAEKLRQSMECTLQAISATVEMRDPYTAGHQRRVARLAAAIGRELGWDAERIHGLFLAGIVHDLGKIYVPAEILSKPGRLTDLEYGLIKIHPQTGHEILKDIEFPWPIAAVLLQHHERLDGSGYPNGLKGNEILPEAKILAVADTVEAMWSHRPYRPGLGLEAGLDEIVRQRGVKFDSDAVDACVRLFRERGYVIAEPA